MSRSPIMDAVLFAAARTVGMRWSNRATWGGAFPAQGTPIILPSGFNLIMDVALNDSEAPGLITINPGATLTVDPALDTRLVCDGLYVNGGSYLAGTPSAAHPTKHFIDLCGARPLISGNAGGGALVIGPTHTGPGAGTSTGNNGTTNDNRGFSRGFMLEGGGKINLYGQSHTNTRRLNAHYASGTTLVLDSPVTAKAGDTVLVSPTGMFNASTRTETRTLAADVNNSATITINAALGYARWGLLQYATDTGISTTNGTFAAMKSDAGVDNVIDQRAFVCIMNRSIRIRGYDRIGGNTDLALYGFGFHGMTMGGLDTETVLKNVEMVNYGQLGLQGRYGWHFHMTSYNADGSFKTGGIAGSNGVSANFPAGKARIEGCSGRQGFNRFLTLHGCRGVEMANNTGHDSAGHTVFEEDQSEEDNIVSGNVSLAPRDPTATYRLKAHEVDSSGFWLSNHNNTHTDNWGVDSPAHGIWNAIGPGLYAYDSDARAAYIASPSTTSGCLGASSKVPLWPLWAKRGVWQRNAGFVCGKFGVMTAGPPNSNAGDIAHAIASAKSTIEGLPTGTLQPFKLTGITAFKALDGGYFNFVDEPDYQYAKIGDNRRTHFAGSTRTGANKFPLIWYQSQNHESSILAAAVVNGLATYHNLLTYIGVMAYGFSGGVARQLQGNLLKSNDGILGHNAVLQAWDLYNEPYVPLSVDDTNWKLFDSVGFWHSPGFALMNDTTTYNAYNPAGAGVQWNENSIGGTGGGLANRGDRACVIYDHWGFLTTGPSTAGTPQTHIIYNQPYFTTGLVTTPMPEGAESVYTTTPLFGLFPHYNENHSTYYSWAYSAQWQRLDSSGTAIAGAAHAQRAYVTGDPFTGSGLHASACPKDGITYLHFPDSTVPNATRFMIGVHKTQASVNTAYANDADAFTLVIDWSGAVSPNVFASREVNFDLSTSPSWFTDTPPSAKSFTSTASRVALLASVGWTYWQDTANNKLWIKYKKVNMTMNGYYSAGPPIVDTLFKPENIVVVPV